MICDKGVKEYTSYKQVETLKSNLSAKYKLTEIKDYGSCIVMRNFAHTILAEIFIEGENLRYQVDDSTEYFKFAQR
jgi:hypothetical protein